MESLRSSILWCKKRKFLTENPIEEIAKFDTTPVKIRRAMTIEEIKLLLEGCAPHRRLLYEVAACSGHRENELFNASDLNDDEDEDFCDDCFRVRQRDVDRPIHQYTCKPPWIYHRSCLDGQRHEVDSFFLGVELEVENTSNGARHSTSRQGTGPCRVQTGWVDKQRL